MFAAGARYETAEIGGIAHFAEHMFFKGTERRPTARDIATEIDGIGGEFNAFTGKEYTGYYVKCAAGTRDVALDVLADMLRNSRLDPEEIEREKGVIVEEMNMYHDTPRDFIGGVYENLLYGDQPLGRDIIGTKESVRAATRETFASFIDRWYRPERMVVGLGGKIGDGLSDRLEELLGSIEPGETGAPEPVVIPLDGSPVKVHTKQSDQAHIILGARSYPLGHPDRYALQLLATVLGGGMSSRLFTEVRERRGLAYYVFGTNSASTSTASMTPSRRSPASSASSRRSPFRRRSSGRRARLPRVDSCSGSRARTARSCSAFAVRCCREVPRSPRPSSRGSTPSAQTTSSASRRMSSASSSSSQSSARSTTPSGSSGFSRPMYKQRRKDAHELFWLSRIDGSYRCSGPWSEILSARAD